MFYTTLPIPYVNGDPHLGALLESLTADTFARYKRRTGERVKFSMGLDQHGLKIFQKARDLNMETKDYVQRESQKFIDLWKTFEITNDIFTQTSDLKHKVIAQIFWQKLAKRKLIYKKTYTGLYCVGCEAFYSTGQLNEDGCCPIHLTEPIEMKEENYFFKLSEFTLQVKDYLQTADIRPTSVKLEWLNFIKEGLEDISISRDSKNLPWGIPVPEDDGQVMYVWFEALINYLTGLVDEESVDKYLEFPLQKEEFAKEIWDQVKEGLPINMEFMGKDMPKFHLVIWTAMLLGIGLEPTEINLVHGFINDKNGRKMSKSMGNGVSPLDLVAKFGVEGTRFIMLYEINTYDDTNFDLDKITASYNANLANNLGNLVMRVSNLSEKLLSGILPEPQLEDLENFEIPTPEGKSKEFDLAFSEVLQNMENYQPQRAVQALFNQISLLNEYLEQTKPWSLAKDLPKNRSEIEKILGLSAFALRKTGEVLSIFMPNTGARIYEIFAAEIITKAEILFPRIENKK